MIFSFFTNPISFFIWSFALLVAITIHEFSHSLAADRLGDPTPRINGRLTLNPLAHLDLIGTLILLLTNFGWGKPVPIDPYNLENPRRDEALISLAGPISNLILAIILSFFLRIISISSVWPIFHLILSPVIILNVSLCIFNLLPFPPLDGSKIFFGLLANELTDEWEGFFNQYSLLIIFLLLFPFSGQPLVSQLIMPIINFILDLLL